MRRFLSPKRQVKITVYDPDPITVAGVNRLFAAGGRPMQGLSGSILRSDGGQPPAKFSGYLGGVLSPVLGNVNLGSSRAYKSLQAARALPGTQGPVEARSTIDLIGRAARGGGLG